MLDLKFVRENPDLVKAGIAKKNDEGIYELKREYIKIEDKKDTESDSNSH